MNRAAINITQEVVVGAEVSVPISLTPRLDTGRKARLRILLHGLEFHL